MKRLFFLSVIFLNALLSYSQSVAVNTDGSAADTSAMLDIKSTIKGILIPRMGTAERQAIVTPAIGLLVFDNDALSFWFFNGANWIELGGGGAAGSWAANGADIYNINSGNVGIGLPSPLAPLHIKKDLEALRIEGTSPYISFFNDAGIVPKTFIQNSNDNLYLGTSTGNINGMTQVYLNGNPGMTLLPTGQVGIGTVTPADKLTVATPGASYGLTHTDGITTVGTWIGTDAFFPGGWVGTKSNHPLNFFTAGGAAQMIILPNGNVGIGTVNPTLKLSVNGFIRSKEIVVETGWADYVFDKQYKLRPLEKVEAFIKANGHLPGILPAKEIVEKGLAVGEMQTKMIEKIEELTLYLIETNKLLKEAKNEINVLKAKHKRRASKL